MASSDVQEVLPTNGHVHQPDDADNARLCDVEHEDTTGTNPVEPRDRPEQEKQLRPAPSDSEHHPASQSAPDKHKPSTSPAKRPLPVHTTTKGPPGPPTPQVKKVLIFRPSFVTPFLTCTSRIADIKLGQVWRGRHQGCSTSSHALHFC
jgi:hypothetical protein